MILVSGGTLCARTQTIQFLYFLTNTLLLQRREIIDKQFTDQVIHLIQDDGVAWFGGVTWRGQRAMRISVCNWQTSDGDIDRTIASVRRALARQSALAGR